MIISHKYKFIFIKTRKTAGTSIEVFLSDHCDANDILTPVYPPVDAHQPRNYRGIWNPLPDLYAPPPATTNDPNYKISNRGKSFFRRQKFYNHIPAYIVKRRISPNIWNSYFKFCVERNPWDKTLSHYHMYNYRQKGKLTLDQYFEDGKYCLNYPLYTDKNNQVMVDKIIKYESLTDGLSKVFDKLNIPFDGNFGVRTKSEYRRDKRPYQEVLSPEQIEMINNIFAQEIIINNY